MAVYARDGDCAAGGGRDGEKKQNIPKPETLNPKPNKGEGSGCDTRCVNGSIALECKNDMYLTRSLATVTMHRLQLLFGVNPKPYTLNPKP